ncbi:MAG TPA: hypothetical protein PLH97_13725 [Verrucomicrobiota bacterium]|nr:hypothetical protein [Verrucomicrobiota bacterium]
MNGQRGDLGLLGVTFCGESRDLRLIRRVLCLKVANGFLNILVRGGRRQAELGDELCSVHCGLVFVGGRHGNDRDLGFVGPSHRLEPEGMPFVVRATTHGPVDRMPVKRFVFDQFFFGIGKLHAAVEPVIADLQLLDAAVSARVFIALLERLVVGMADVPGQAQQSRRRVEHALKFIHHFLRLVALEDLCADDVGPCAVRHELHPIALALEFVDCENDVLLFGFHDLRIISSCRFSQASFTAIQLMLWVIISSCSLVVMLPPGIAPALPAPAV